jgi:hypothetical protein
VIEAVALVGAAAVTLTIVTVSRFLGREARLARTIRKMPSTAMAAARDGRVCKIVGVLEPIEELGAPITLRACACWEVTVEGAEGRSGWSQLAREDGRRNFLLRDGDQRALVRVEGARLWFGKDYEFTSGTFVDPDPTTRFEEFMKEHHIATRGWVFNKQLRCREGVLARGQPVAVVGLARWEPDPDAASGGAYREAPQRLVLEAGGDLPLVVTNREKLVRRSAK